MTQTTLPSFLYHGTRAAHEESILAHDLMPRGQSGESQWAHTVESRPDAVYLSTAYPLHYAVNAQAEGDLLILEIETGLLEADRLIADEDALAHSLREPETRHMDLLEKTLYYRDRSHNYPASTSLALMGTCAHLGPVPKQAIRRIARIRVADIGTLVFGGFDPVVSPINFSIFGQEYAESVRWIFGDTEICAVNPNMPRVAIEVTRVGP